MILEALHLDGFVLFVASICMLILGQGYHRWRFRVPVIALGFLYFALAVSHLSLFRPVPPPIWSWFRVGADSMTLVLVVIYLIGRNAQHRSEQATRPKSQARRQRAAT